MGAAALLGCLLLAGCAGHGKGATANRNLEAPAAAARLPAPGWAREVVRAGHAVYVVGWDRHNTAALWHVDAGGRLSPRTPPPGMGGNPGSSSDGVLSLDFQGRRTGLAITGRLGDEHHTGRTVLYATADGARTWTPIRLPTREQPIRVAIGDGAAYALTSNCGRPAAACDHATLWSVDPTGARPPRSFDSLPAKTHTAGPIAIAASGAHVWVLLNMGFGKPTPLRSTDGGRTWQRFRADDCIWENPVATSNSVLWSTCGTGMLEHFARQVRGGKPVGVFPEVAGTSNSALLPLGNSTAYAVIEDRHGTRIEATFDGGRTTTTVASIPRSIARRGFQTTFVSPKVGYLITRNGGQLYRTTDAAHTWHKLPQPAQG